MVLLMGYTWYYNRIGTPDDILLVLRALPIVVIFRLPQSPLENIAQALCLFLA